MYNREPVSFIETSYRKIPVFVDDHGANIDRETVDSFGEEWSKFNDFSNEEIAAQAKCYFDIIPEGILTSSTVLADFGCGSGKFSKFMASKVGTVYSIDPSKAIMVADRILGNTRNAVLCKASISDLPFTDGFFDFGMAIGVLHHIPDTQRAMEDCVKKIKKGGHFLVYIYYNFDNRGPLFKALWKLSEVIRFVVSRLPSGPKSFVCDLLAAVIYMPFVLTARTLNGLGVEERIWRKIPLSTYVDKTFFIVRNDCLDRFGTPLESRYSKEDIESMMKKAGLVEIKFSDFPGYWHAIGQRG